MRIRLLFHVLLLGVGVCLFSGCATPRDVEVARILRELEADLASVDEATDEETAENVEVPEAVSPEQPDNGLPSLAAAELPNNPGPLTTGNPHPVGNPRPLGDADPDPSPEAPSDMLPPSGELTIQPDCLLQITVEEDSTLDGSYPVNAIGAVQLGYVGPVILYNKTEKAAARKIEDILRSRHFRKAHVDVRIIRASYDKVRVIGAVAEPGLIKIGAGDTITLNDALLRAGGLLPSVRGPRVRVVREGLKSALAFALPGEEYSLVSEEGSPSIPDVGLRNNDIAYVYPTKRELTGGVGSTKVLVLGEVRREGFYYFEGAEPPTLMRLIFKMGGLPRYANAGKIRIIREDEDGFEEDIPVDATEILEEGDPDLDIPLQNNDRVIVPARRISLF